MEFKLKVRFVRLGMKHVACSCSLVWLKGFWKETWLIHTTFTSPIPLRLVSLSGCVAHDVSVHELAVEVVVLGGKAKQQQRLKMIFGLLKLQIRDMRKRKKK